MYTSLVYQLDACSVDTVQHIYRQSDTCLYHTVLNNTNISNTGRQLTRYMQQHKYFYSISHVSPICANHKNNNKISCLSALSRVMLKPTLLFTICLPESSETQNCWYLQVASLAKH